MVMKRMAILLALIAAQCLSTALRAEEHPPVRVAVGFSIGPYLMTGGRGIIGDLITESFSKSGLKPEFSYHTNRQAIELFEAGEVDAVTVVRAGMVDGFYSMPLVTFHNHTWSLASRNIVIDSLDDLGSYRVAAFSSAQRFLGPEFEAVVGSLASYEEISDQEQQVTGLLQGKVDVIVADQAIFEFYRRRLINRAPQDEVWRQAVDRGYAFPPSVYHMAFRSEETRNRFDQGLATLNESGRRAEIRQFYLGLLDIY